MVQFVDLNPDVSAFQRQFVSEVKRCEEMERILRFVETEIVREDITITEVREENISAPAPREMVELETVLTKTEADLREVNTNYVALRLFFNVADSIFDNKTLFTFCRKNHLELTELKSMLSRTELFLSETHFSIQDNSDENTRLLEGLMGVLIF